MRAPVLTFTRSGYVGKAARKLGRTRKPMMQAALPGVSRIVTLFLGVWLAVAAITNLFDVLIFGFHFSALAGWGSGNVLEIAGVLGKHFVPPVGVSASLLAGVVLIEAAAAALFFLNRISAAFALTLALFAAFIVIDDAFLQYQIEGAHRTIFIMLCAAYLVVRK